MDKIELGTPFRTVIIKILSCNPKMLSVLEEQKKRPFFQRSSYNRMRFL